jgi:hypothetical protein
MNKTAGVHRGARRGGVAALGGRAVQDSSMVLAGRRKSELPADVGCRSAARAVPGPCPWALTGVAWGTADMY